jgi:heptosyltransferase III
MDRILVIRGGAIGDFILTLPTLKALREAYPDAQLEILGYKHIAVLAQDRFYAQAVRSIEYGALSSFFAKNASLPAELAKYFGNFDLIISYLYDPDGIFETNLRRCGVENLIHGPAKVSNSGHAAQQLAAPMKELGLCVQNFAAKIFSSGEDRDIAERFLRGLSPPVVAFHIGSGSEKKTWPLQNWINIGNHLLGSHKFCGSLVIVCGEADEDQARKLESIWQNQRVVFAKNLPLPHLAAVLARTIFIGHDSGISHLAAAAGANCILLFGSTDPAVWAPLGGNVQVICGANGTIDNIEVGVVEDAIARF